MDFHQALAAKYGVRHLWGGTPVPHYKMGGIIGQAAGDIGDAGTDAYTSASGGVKYYGDQLASGFKGIIPKNNFSPNVPINTFNPDIQNNTFDPALISNGFRPTQASNYFQAVDPQINKLDFASALQQGLGGYSQGAAGLGSSFAAQQALAQQGAQTLGQQQGLYGQQQDLARSLAAQARGEGPNLAEMQLRQDTDRAIAQQASTIASARGISPAIAARIAGAQGAHMQQQEVGQAAMLRAQQQLAAQQALGQQQQALAQNLYGQNATLSNQGNLYNQAAGTAQALGGLGSSLYGTGLSANNAQNSNIINASLGVQGLNSATAQQNADLSYKNQALQAGVAEQNANLAQQQQALKAGVAQQNANLGYQGQALKAGVAEQNANLGMQGEQIKAGVAAGNQQSKNAIFGGLINAGGAAGAAAIGAAHGGSIPDRKALDLASALMGQGGKVPGKAKKAGDDPENDTVPTVLSPDEIVIPRSIAMADDAPEKAAEFVAKLKGKSSSGPQGYGKVLQKHRELQKNLDDLKKMMCGGRV